MFKKIFLLTCFRFFWMSKLTLIMATKIAKFYSSSLGCSVKLKLACMKLVLHEKKHGPDKGEEK